MNFKRDKRLLILSLICLGISSFSILGVVNASYDENYGSKALAITVAVAFWAGLIIGYVLLIMLNKNRRASAVKIGRFKTGGCQFGIFKFFRNKEAIIADVIMLLSLVLFIIFRILDNVSVYLDLTVIALLIYSFHLHCILNGQNYRYIKLLKNDQQKKAENESK